MLDLVLIGIVESVSGSEADCVCICEFFDSKNSTSGAAEGGGGGLKGRNWRARAWITTLTLFPTRREVVGCCCCPSRWWIVELSFWEVKALIRSAF